MKKLLIGFLALVSLSGFAKPEGIKSIHARGEVRNQGKVNTLLKYRLEKLGHKLSPETGNIKVSVGYEFAPYSYWDFVTKASVNVVINDVNTGMVTSAELVCNTEINDGGNQTLKKSCIKRIAKTIDRFLKREN